MKRVLVVGGAGFVGSHVARALLAQGMRPILFGPAMPGAEARLAELLRHVDLHEGSVTSREDLQAVLRASAPDAIVSCAAYGAGRLGLLRSGEADADAAMEVNVLGLARLLDAAREAGVARVIWTSSTVVYGPPSDYPAQPIDEDAPCAAQTLYGLTKMLAEEVSAYHRRRHGLEAVALRLPLVLGPGLWYEGAAAALAALFRNQPPETVAFHGEPIDLAHVADVARAVLLLLECNDPAPIYNLEAVRAGITDIIAAIQARRPGVAIRLDRIPPALPLPLVSGARLQADTGFVPEYDLNRFVDAMLEGGR